MFRKKINLYEETVTKGKLRWRDLPDYQVTTVKIGKEGESPWILLLQPKRRRRKHGRKK